MRRLVGHDNDVQDLGWSYDSSILVSVGLDSKVVVWSGHTFEKLKTLSQHQSHVKGLTFDPANKYFATASDDRTIKIFRFTSPPPNATAHDQVHNFILETTISAPFTTSPLTTYFRRCSWSPDGLHIAAANAVNGPVSSVAIISRGSWESSINFIGHEGPVEVCAFCPRMFYKDPPDERDAQSHNPVTVIACGGQDKSLSIWNTRLTRPFIIAQGLANKSISDLAWSPNGESLFITTLDGSILMMMFQEGELGYVAPAQENDKALSRFGAGRKAGIVEGTDALLLEELSKADELKGVEGRMGELMGDAAKPAVNGTTEAPKVNGTTTPVTNGASTPAQPNPEAIQEAKIAQMKQRVEYVGGKKRVKPLLISSSAAPASSLPQTQLIANTTHVKASGEGPHSILDLSKPYEGLPKGGLAGLLLPNKRKYAEIAGDEERRTEKRLGSLVKDGAAPIVVDGPDGLAPPSLADKAPGDIPPPLLPAIVDPALLSSRLRLATPVLRSVIVRTADGSEPPKPGDSDINDDAVVMEARNASGPSRTGRPQDKDPTRINCTKQGISLWQDYLPRPVSLVTGNRHFWCAACDDGTMYVWTPAGRRLLNAMVLDSQAVILDSRGWWLLCITAVGRCHVWNIETLESPHPPVSLAPILDVAIAASGPHLTGTPGVAFARLNSEGRVVVALTNGDGYTYSPAMFVWQRLSDQWFAVGSQYWNTADSSALSTVAPNGASKGPSGASSTDLVDGVAPENISAGIVTLLERHTTSATLLRGRSYFLSRLVKALLVAEGFEGFEASVSVAHLENRLAAALLLGARDEFRVALGMYAKRLGAEGLRTKAEELLRTLLGEYPGGTEGEEVVAVGQGKTKGRRWFGEDEDICGWKRLDLLRDVVLVLGAFTLLSLAHTFANRWQANIATSRGSLCRMRGCLGLLPTVDCWIIRSTAVRWRRRIHV
jgi:protein HIRA/HIR1